MIKKLMLLFFLCLAIFIGAVYFILWPMAQRYLAEVAAVLQPAVENVAEPLQGLPPVGVGIDGLLAILPILQKIGLDTLTQLQGLAADGVTMEEAQQAMDILRNQLSSEELAQLLAVFNLQQ